MKLLLYCTKIKPFLINDCGKFYLNNKGYNYYWRKGMVALEHLNGKVVAECDFEVEKIKNKLTNNNSHLELSTDKLTEEELFEKSCLSRYEMFNYLTNDFTKKDKNGYAIHIKNLHIFGKPRELSEYYKTSKINTFDGYDLVDESIDKAPQNMMYCYDEKGKKYALISIQSKWLCKILNGEKTIEVRKKVLKEMLTNEKINNN